MFDEAGTTRDAIEIPFERRGKPYVLIDTAGIRRRKNVREIAEKFSIIKTLDAIKESHVVIMVLDGSSGLVEQDLHLLDYVLTTGRAWCWQSTSGTAWRPKPRIKCALK